MTSLSHILFATDWPFSVPVFVAPGDPAPQLSETVTTDERLAVERLNAVAPVPRPRAATHGLIGLTP